MGWVEIGATFAAMLGFAGWTGMNDEGGKRKRQNFLTSVGVLLVILAVIFVAAWIGNSN